MVNFYCILSHWLIIYDSIVFIEKMGCIKMCKIHITFEVMTFLFSSFLVSRILDQLKDIYSICRSCSNVATYKWKVHNGKMEITSFDLKFRPFLSIFRCMSRYDVVSVVSFISSSNGHRCY